MKKAAILLAVLLLLSLTACSGSKPKKDESAVEAVWDDKTYTVKLTAINDVDEGTQAVFSVSGLSMAVVDGKIVFPAKGVLVCAGEDIPADKTNYGGGQVSFIFDTKDTPESVVLYLEAAGDNEAQRFTFGPATMLPAD